MEARLSYPPMIRDLQCVPKSLTGYIKELNWVYVASNDKLFVWRVGLKEHWFPCLSIPHPICRVQFVHFNEAIINGTYSRGLVVVTTQEVLLLAFPTTCQQLEPSARIVDLKIVVPLDGEQVIDVIGTKSGRILLMMQSGEMQELLYTPTVISFFLSHV